MKIANPFRLLRESLRIRIFTLLTFLILVISSAFILFHFTSESSALTERSVTEGNLLARFLAESSRIAVFAENTQMIQDSADLVLRNDNVASVAVFSSDGRLLADRTKAPRKSSLSIKDRLPAITATIVPLLKGKKKTLSRDKGDYFEFFAPIWAGPARPSAESLYFDKGLPEPKGRVIGAVLVVLDKSSLNEHLHDLLITTSLMSVFFLVLAAIGAFLVAQGLTRSLHGLMKGVTTLEQGDMSGRIVVKTHDELGIVSQAFNTMAETLEKREREKQSLEDQLRTARENQAKEEWERTFDTVPDHIAVLDKDNRITRINEAMATLLKTGKDQATGTFLFELFDGAFTPPYEQEMAEALTAGLTYSTEIYKERLNRYFFVTISPLFNERNRTGSVYVARDITRSKLDTEMLRISEERFRIIADNINEVFWMADADMNRVLYVSPAYEHIYGRSRQSLYEKPSSFMAAIHPGDRDRVKQNIFAEPEQRESEQEFRIVRPDGTQRWIWERRYPVYNDDGKVTFVTGVDEDITEKRQSDEEKKKIQAKLVQINKMTSLGLLVSGLAHEVNNPNSSIKLAAHILAKSWEDIKPILEKYYLEEGDFPVSGQLFSGIKDNLPQHIASITANSRRIEGIIKNLRDFAQKGAANMTYQIDINTVVSLSASIINTQVKLHTRNFKLSLKEGLPAVRGNPQQLEQVIINLIMNAIQSLPDRERKVLVSTSFDAAAGTVRITVEDEGEGMPKEVRERICEPFFSTKLDKGGSGLGLAISNFIIKEHNGSLEFKSEVGWGTTAIVSLPALHA
jgi:PAS domain S-box-containing protein